MPKKSFFEEENESMEEKKEIEGEKQEEQKFKVGEEEYTQEELEKLVGLGKIGQEAEEKFKTKLDRVWPDYTKKSQRVIELEEKIKGLETQMAEKPTPKVGDLTEEEKQFAKQQLINLIGDEPVTKKEFADMVKRVILETQETRDLIEECKTVVEQMEEEGKPKTTVEELLQHMGETGIRIPQKAYNDKFEPELDKLKEAEFRKLKPASNFVTTESSTAGGKQPSPIKINKGNLQDLIKQSLWSAENLP
jgi:hypothetical protein